MLFFITDPNTFHIEKYGMVRLYQWRQGSVLNSLKQMVLQKEQTSLRTQITRSLKLIGIYLSLFTACAFAATEEPEDFLDHSFYGRLYTPFQGDLPEMQQRRLIRVLVSPSRTNFFFDGRQWRGLEYELLKNFETHLNRGPQRKRYITHLTFMPRAFADIIPGLTRGHGDIGAAGLTITPEREQLVDFTLPYLSNINEVLVSDRNQPAPTRLEDLAGAKIVVVRGSSYASHVQQFNQGLLYRGLPPMEVIQAEPELEMEDLLEMVNAHLIRYTVADEHIASLWSEVLPNIRVQKKFIFHYNGQIGWAVRKNTPELKAALNTFIRSQAKPGKLLSNILYKRYFENTRWIRSPLKQTTIKRFHCYRSYFELFADFYDLSWSLLAAVAYVESGLDPHKKSPAGAVGLMQIKPSIGRMLGITHITKPYNNIHAGAAYLAWLRDNYYNSPVYSIDDQINFTLAAYNAGPTRIRRLQREAKKAGLDPFKWFYNVELIARKRIGQETVNYVTKVRKTRTAIHLFTELKYDKEKLKSHFIDEAKADTP